MAVNQIIYNRYVKVSVDKITNTLNCNHNYACLLLCIFLKYTIIVNIVNIANNAMLTF